MVSSTTSLMLGMEGVIRTRYPNDFVVYANEETKDENYKVFEQIKRFQKEKNLNVTGEMEYSYLAFSSINEGDKFNVGRSGSIADMNDIASDIRYLYGFDTDAGEEEQNAFYGAMLDVCETNQYQVTAESRCDARTSFIGLYGGFFFIGIFRGFLFIMATVLIIYYKQISEGYDDKERFAIMQKVGMSHQEVKSSIHSQVLTVFFMPLLAAGIHIAAAFPMISRLLAVLNLLNVKLYLICTIICFLVFAFMYMLIYFLTAKNYYKIVSR